MVKNEIEVTSLEERVLRYVESQAEEGNQVSVNDITSALKLSKSSVYSSLYGRKGASEGLFKKLPALRHWIIMVRRKKRSKYDVSFFLDHEQGIAKKKVRTSLE